MYLYLNLFAIAYSIIDNIILKTVGGGGIWAKR